MRSRLKRLLLPLSAAALAAALGAATLPFWRDEHWGSRAGGSGASGAARPASGAADAAPAAAPLYAELQRHLQRQPRDGRALVFKARMDMQAERFELASAGYARALSVAPRVARDPGVWVEYAEARGMALGGTLVGEPQQLLQKALAIDARHAQALDLAGSAAWERRDYAQAALHWKRLLEQTPPGSARHAALSAALERAEQRARVSLPPKS